MAAKGNNMVSKNIKNNEGGHRRKNKN